MRSIDASKLAAVCCLLESDESKHLRAWLALGIDPWTIGDGDHAQRAGRVAADYVRDLARRLEQHFVEFGRGDESTSTQVLHQDAEKLAVGVCLQCGRLAQRVEDPSSNV